MNPAFQLIDRNWEQVIRRVVAMPHGSLHVICPFIKRRTIERLCQSGKLEMIQVITRFNLAEFNDGISDTAALRFLLERGARIRGIKNLHAKLYLFGDQRAIVTSANLTEAALLRNHEFGFVTSQADTVAQCRSYFEQLWQRAGSDLTFARLEEWERSIESVRVSGAQPKQTADLPDEGSDAGFTTAPSIIVNSGASSETQSFVKFFGEGHNRVAWSTPVFSEVKDTGSHWACTYPLKKRPRRVQDGDVMFLARLVKDPNDILIYGRAIAMRHVEGRDEASKEEIEQRDWKEIWPNYIRVHHAEFVAGTLANGVLLSELMDDLKAGAFASTARNVKAGGEGNTDPRAALKQKPDVQLTDAGAGWVSARLQQAFQRFGKLAASELEKLDWPATKANTSPANLEDFATWMIESDGKQSGTSRIYCRFLSRCSEHYGEVIDEHTVDSDVKVEQILVRINTVVATRDRWARGTFNRHDVTDNLTPALRAYVRFVRATYLR